MYSAVTREAQCVMLDENIGGAMKTGFLLYGLTSAEYGYSIPMANVNVLGKQTTGMIMSGPREYSVSLSKSLTNLDILWALTGYSGINVLVSHNYNTGAAITSGIAFRNGAISDYSVAVQAGGIPAVSVGMIFAGDYPFETGMAKSAIEDYSLAYVPSSGISLNVGGQNGANVISSAQFSAKFNWIKEPRLASNTDDSDFFMQLVRPVEFTASIELTIDEYMIDAASFSNPKTWILTITDESVNQLAVNEVKNAQLVGEGVRIGAGGSPVVSLQYRGVG